VKEIGNKEEIPPIKGKGKREKSQNRTVRAHGKRRVKKV